MTVRPTRRASRRRRPAPKLFVTKQRAAKEPPWPRVGNRMAGPSGMPWLRRQVNRAMSWWLSRLAGCEWPDTQCGFRLVNLEALSQLKLRSHRFTVESEMMLAFAAAGHRIDFVPVEAIYEGERSRIRPLKDTWRWLRWLA